MKVLVSASGHFVETPDGTIWTVSPIYGYSFWTRYLDVFDEVAILIRVRKMAEPPVSGTKVLGPGIRVLSIPDFGIRNKKLLWQAMPLVKKYLRGAEAILIRVPWILADMIFFLIDSNRPIALEVIGDPYDAFAPRAFSHPLRPFLRYWQTWSLKKQCYKASAVAYVTKSYLQRRYPSNPNAFSTHYSSINLPDEAFVSGPREEAFFFQRPFTLLFVGTLQQLYKGQDILIKAFRLCTQKFPELKLVLIGDGQYRGYLENLSAQLGVRNRIVFVGQVPPGKPVWAWMDKTHLFVLPSITEGLPRAMIEAMARGLPTIGTTVGGIPELLPPEVLVPPNDVQALASKICKLVQSPQWMAQLSARNLEKAWSYHIDIIKKRRLTFYRVVREQTEEWLKMRG